MTTMTTTTTKRMRSNMALTSKNTSGLIVSVWRIIKPDEINYDEEHPSEETMFVAADFYTAKWVLSKVMDRLGYDLHKETIYYHPEEEHWIDYIGGSKGVIESFRFTLPEEGKEK